MWVWYYLIGIHLALAIHGLRRHESFWLWYGLIATLLYVACARTELRRASR
jgi:hypothetical protein